MSELVLGGACSLTSEAFARPEDATPVDIEQLEGQARSVARRWRKVRSLAQRRVPPTELLGPGMYGPGQTHRDGPLSARARAAWNYVIGGLIVAGLLFFVLAAVFHWG